MQAAKDSVFVALSERLKQLNPTRTVLVAGELRPGLIVTENQATGAQPADAFCMEWGEAKPLVESPLVHSTLMAAELTIRYRTGGQNHGDCDRGRCLNAMDAELLAMCVPAKTGKMDYSAEQPRSLGTSVFWKAPVLSALIQTPSDLSRTATTTVFFYPECAA